MDVPSGHIHMEVLERIHEKDPACLNPQPASHLSAVPSHGDAQMEFLQRSLDHVPQQFRLPTFFPLAVELP